MILLALVESGIRFLSQLTVFLLSCQARKKRLHLVVTGIECHFE
jgi:hypothetical protein